MNEWTENQSLVAKNQSGETVKNQKPTSMAITRSKAWYIIYLVSILVLYNPLVQILRLKYQGRNETPFETQGFLIRTSVIAFVVAGLTLPLVIDDYLSSSSTARRRFSPEACRVIKKVYFVAGFVAHVSVVLILFID